jgi:hypothetical protein
MPAAYISNRSHHATHPRAHSSNHLNAGPFACAIREQVAGMTALDAKLEAYLLNPTDCLDLSALRLDMCGAQKVVIFLLKW